MNKAILRILGHWYKRVVPRSVRRWVKGAPALGNIYQHIAQNTATHDLVYSEDYYTQRDEALSNKQTTKQVVLDIVEQFSPRSVLDVGCGAGWYLAEFAHAGVDAKGVELAKAGVDLCRRQGLTVEQFDLTDRSKSMPFRGDLVFCVEVAEHLPESSADLLVERLTASADRFIVMTAAHPGQDGTNHFNCQPKKYWIDKVTSCGFQYERELTESWQSMNRQRGLFPWFWINLMVFSKGANNLDFTNTQWNVESTS